jgi:hypothetical protein
MRGQLTKTKLPETQWPETQWPETQLPETHLLASLSPAVSTAARPDGLTPTASAPGRSTGALSG